VFKLLNNNKINNGVRSFKMKKLFNKIKDTFAGSPGTFEGDDKDSSEEGYVELDTEAEEVKSKIIIRPFTIKDFEDLRDILDSLREGYTIALINIKPLKDKDLVELKRAINKLKKTCDAIEGEIAGFGEDWIVVTPSFAQIYRNKQTAEIKDDAGSTTVVDEPVEQAAAPAEGSTYSKDIEKEEDF